MHFDHEKEFAMVVKIDSIRSSQKIYKHSCVKPVEMISVSLTDTNDIALPPYNVSLEQRGWKRRMAEKSFEE